MAAACPPKMPSGPAETPAHRLLKQARVRPSAARVQVLDALLDTPQALSHGQIMEKLGPGHDRVTLYRTLQTLEDAGVLHRVKTHERSVRFAVARSLPQEHAHVLCEECGAVACLDETPPPPPPASLGWAISTREMTFYGTCPACR